MPGSGFRDVTRIAESPTVMWRDILLANRTPVLDALAELGGACERLRAAVAAVTAARSSASSGARRRRAGVSTRSRRGGRP